MTQTPWQWQCHSGREVDWSLYYAKYTRPRSCIALHSKDNESEEIPAIPAHSWRHQTDGSSEMAESGTAVDVTSDMMAEWGNKLS